MPVAAPEQATATPYQEVHGCWLKREDLYVYAGQRGGKVRTCQHLAREAEALGATELVTAGSRHSPQVNIVAHVAHAMGMASTGYCPTGPLGDELLAAEAAGMHIVQVKPGHNSVIKARAREHAAQAPHRALIPFGMECLAAVAMTARQVAPVPEGVQRMVVPVGSGMSLAGVLHGLILANRPELPVLGVCVGADPRKRLDAWAPELWAWGQCELVQAEVPYHQRVRAAWGGVQFDPVYEAKCVPYLRPGDCLWVVGVRQHVG